MTELPKGWITVDIGALCDLKNGRAFKPNDWTDKGKKIVRIQNLNNPKAHYNHFDGDVRERFIIQTDDLLFAWSGTPGTSFGAHIWRGMRHLMN
jgi:type I restriction enzyme S subunit